MSLSSSFVIINTVRFVRQPPYRLRVAVPILSIAAENRGAVSVEARPVSCIALATVNGRNRNRIFLRQIGRTHGCIVTFEMPCVGSWFLPASDGAVASRLQGIASICGVRRWHAQACTRDQRRQRTRRQVADRRHGYWEPSGYATCRTESFDSFLPKLHKESRGNFQMMPTRMPIGSQLINA
jgi:hypothetical protein